jgi:hypothetical protein
MGKGVLAVGISLLVGLGVEGTQAYALPTRTERVADGQIVRIKTALGMSTIIKFADRPRSTIIGDQDAFRIEAFGDGLAIKPIIASATSNLYVVTSEGDFRFILEAGKRESADFVVTVKRKLRVRSEPSIFAAIDPAEIFLEHPPIRNDHGLNSLSITSIDDADLGATIQLHFMIAIGPNAFGNRGISVHRDNLRATLDGQEIAGLDLKFTETEICPTKPVNGLLRFPREILLSATELRLTFSADRNFGESEAPSVVLHVTAPANLRIGSVNEARPRRR